MRGEYFGFILLAVFLIFIPIATTQTQTSVEVPYNNLAPVFSGLISNQTWAKNTNLLNSINLDSYFSDNQTMNFSASSVQNITITINDTGSGNFVSFYPDTGFAGIRNVVFNATDGTSHTSSNIVYLNVSEDTSAPQWSNPSKNRNEIYQNLVVAFSTSWTDNVMLESYKFYIAQNGGWTESEERGFSGTQATASYSIQISAAGGTGVQWYFTAKDSSGNENSSAVQNFTVLSNPTSGSSSSSSSSSSRGSSGSQGVQKTVKKQLELIKEFIIDPAISFKIDTKQGQSNTISIKITNTGNQPLSFNLSAIDLEEFEVKMSESSFDLEPGRSKTIVIEIKVGKHILPDIYTGKIRVSSTGETVDIPVVIEVNELEAEYSLDLVIEENSKEVRPGEDVFANLTLSNLKDIAESKVSLYYAIRGYDGLIVNFREENFTFNKKTQSMNLSLKIGEESEVGEYIFYARALVDGEVILASDIFEIGERFNLASFVRANLLLIGLIMILISIMVFAVKYNRNKERLRLLNLYVMIKEMKTLLAAGKLDEAIDVYVKIKRSYGEKMSDISNKEDLKKQMEQFASKSHDLDKPEAQPNPAEKKEGAKAEVKEEKPKEETKEEPKEEKTIQDAKEKEEKKSNPEVAKNEPKAKKTKKDSKAKNKKVKSSSKKSKKR